jgi:hypothetical protein
MPRSASGHALSSQLIGARLADRFAVERHLGAGGMGIVYEVLDERRQERVALKTLGRVDPTAIYRLKQEFRALVDLVHPNLVRLHELFSDEGVWFFTMARVDGVPFHEYVRDDTKPAEDKLRKALGQLVLGVGAIHAAGKLHRDLKPSNVLVDATGHVTILDFGLVSAFGENATRSQDGGGAGTPAYMAPEQLMAGGPRPANDWYAVGVMLFQALTGRLPFEGTISDVISAKASGRTPEPACVLSAAVPQDLSDLASALLDSRPDARPSREHILRALDAHSAPTLAIDVAPGPIKERAFVGRERELARLQDAFLAVTSGEPRIVAISGVSGIGKTALIERFFEELEATAPNAVILSGRCYERESLPFKALDAVVDALSRHLSRLPPVQAALSIPRDLPELCRIFPVLARVPTLASALVGRAASEDAHEVRRRAFEALRELFSRTTDTRPLVIAIDDLQWGDVDSGRLLMRLVAPPDPPKMLMLAAYRSDEVEQSPLLALLADFARREGHGRVETISLEPLGQEFAVELAQKILGERGEERAATLIAEESGGSPFFIGELARASEAEGAKSASLPDLINKRVLALGSEARSLLEVVAIAGGPVMREAALRAAHLEPSNDSAIPVLRSASLLRSANERLETYHDRIRETVVSTLGIDRQRELSGRLADALASLPSPPIEVLAHHSRQAGRTADALRYSVEAADRAANALAFDRAARLYQAAIELAPEDATAARRNLLRKLADAFRDAGRGREAADLYLGLCADAQENERIDLEGRAADALLACGEIDRGVAAARAVMARVGVWMPESPLAAFVLGMLLFFYAYLRGARSVPRALRPLDSAKARRIDVLQSLAGGFGLTDTMHGAYISQRLGLAGRASGDVVVIMRALFNECWSIAWARPLDSGISPRLERMRDLAKAHSHPKLDPLEALSAGMCAFLQGRWRASREALERAENGFLRCNDAFTELSVSRAFHTWSLFYLGAFRQLSERVPALAADARARGDIVALNGQVSAFGAPAWLAKDDLNTASSEVDDAFSRWPCKRFQLQNYWYLLARGLIDLYAGEGVRLHAQYERDWPLLRRSTLLVGAIVSQQLVWCRTGAAILAAGKAEASRASKLLSAAELNARKLARNPVLGSASMASLLLGAISYARGDDDAARKRLASAVPTFEELDMRAFAAASKRILGRLQGGDEGAKLVAEADAFMASEGIVNPARFAAMLTPGFKRD